MKILRAVVNFIYELLLGCRHDHLTRLFTIEQHTYKVCLECGKQIYYSADTMLPLSRREVRRMLVTKTGALKVIPVGNVTTLDNKRSSKAIA
jgi:hypothetical protein